MAAERKARHREWLLQWWPILAVAVLALGYAALVGVAWMVQANAHEMGARAMREFPGDEVEALMALVQSDRHTLAERNHAVNALGLIGDARARPALEEFYTGEPCRHDTFLCQSELKKAIDKCRGRGRAPTWLPFLPR
jgi:hypothetical protein